MKEARFLGPEIVNIRREALTSVFRHWQFWFFVIFALLIDWLLWETASSTGGDNFLFPWLVPLLYYSWMLVGVNRNFWRQFAAANGWEYKGRGDPRQEAAAIIRYNQNSFWKSRSGSEIVDQIKGKIDGRDFRIFNFYFTQDKFRLNYLGKNPHLYTVFGFKFDGSFPHIYLDRKNNWYQPAVGERVPLPEDFEKKFSLFAPKKYEQEALEIFTPEIMRVLLEGEFPHDVELVDGEMLIFAKGGIGTFSTLSREFNRALEIKDLLDKKLDRLKLHPIGDLPHRL